MTITELELVRKFGFVCTLLTVVICGAVFALNARAASYYGWTHAWGSSSDTSISNDTVTDSSGNVYVVGYFDGTGVDFDPGTGTDTHSAVGGDDVYLTKYDNDGNFLWARTWGSTTGDSAFGVDVDDADNVYVTGRFGGASSENVDFDGTTGTDNHVAAGNFANLYVVKYNSDGTYGWAQTLGGTDNNIGTGITVTSDGSIFVSGYFGSGTVDFDPTGTTENHSTGLQSKSFITKYTTSGAYVWTKTTDGTGKSEGDSIVADDSGNVYMSGYYSGTIDLDPGAGTDSHTYADNAAIISKFDTDGNYVWTQRFEGSVGGDTSISYGISMDSTGSVYGTGFFMGTVDFDPSGGTDNHTSAGNEDIFIVKVDASGAFGWAKSVGDAQNERGTAIAVDPNDNVYVGGFFSGSVDFDPGAGTDTKTDISDWGITAYVTGYDKDGTYLWTETPSGGQETDGYGVAASAYGVYLSGDLYGTADFDPGGTHDNVVGATDWGSSFITKWTIGTPSPSPTPTPSPSPSSSSAPSTSTSTSSPAPAPSPGSAPVITSADVDIHSVTLHFTPAADPKTGYAVRYGRTPDANEYGANPIGDAQSTSLTINDLNADTVYYFVLQGVNSGTGGPVSQVFSARTRPESSTVDQTMVTVTESSPTPTSTTTTVYDVKIIITDLQDDPLPGVDISVISGTTVESSQSTDDDGSSLFTDIPAGTYDVVIKASDGTEVMESLTVNDGSDKIVTFKLGDAAFNPGHPGINQIISGTPEKGDTTPFGTLKETFLTIATPQNLVLVSKAGVETTAAAVVAVAAAGLIGTSAAVSKVLLAIYSGTSSSMMRLPGDISRALAQKMGHTMYDYFPFLALVRKKRKKHGVVFDSVGDVPVAGAYVVLYSKSGNLKTAFTDIYGSYYLQAKPDEYELKVEHKSYLFPSTVVKVTANEVFDHIYSHGEVIKVADGKDPVSGIAVPLDPKVVSGLSKIVAGLRNFLSAVLKILKIPLLLISLFTVTTSVLYEPNFFTLSAAFIVTVWFVSFISQSLAPDPADAMKQFN